MMHSWPSLDTLDNMHVVPHRRLEDKARRTGASRSVYTVEVPTPGGLFGVSATAFGVAMVFFPGVKEADVARRMSSLSVQEGELGRQRAIEAGLELIGYFLKESKHFTVPVDFSFVRPFQKDIYNALTSIPFAETITYAELATLAGHPGKARAVGVALAKNPAPLFVPCHRVVAANGLGGWSGPIGWKEWLLEHEGV